ncbi:DNA-binding protein [bacterium endosymbiont of Escarpia laminata]|nr:MAG: DNA-binding protein [bacterium endosymbiont of Escarpia laminata]RLJ18242.1 MAG: DNA-binding protein [bacterium endosymbiont of Escarpia laminata]
MSVPKLLTPDEVSDLLGVTTHTLAVWRSEKRYSLCYIKTGRLVRYREEDVIQFIQDRTQGQKAS